MYKRTMTYTDYNGVERTEDFYFNISKAELIEMNLKEPGGLEAKIKRIIAEQDQGQMIEMFKELILMSYGEKSPDGKYFIKKKNGEKLSENFEQTEAFSDMYWEFVTNDKAASDFVNNIIPKVEEKA